MQRAGHIAFHGYYGFMTGGGRNTVGKNRHPLFRTQTPGRIFDLCNAGRKMAACRNAETFSGLTSDLHTRQFRILIRHAL